MMNERREAKFRATIRQRQPNLTLVLENVHDPHNLSAVLRTADSIGLMEIYAIYSDPLNKGRLHLGKRSSMGARKWVDVQLYKDTDTCLQAVKEKYGTIYGTLISERSTTIYEADFTQSCAIMLGNEHKGLTPEAQRWCDGHIIIPQMGMAESLNIASACAVAAYEALRQRFQAGIYEHSHFSAQEEDAMLVAFNKRADELKGDVYSQIIE